MVTPAERLGPDWVKAYERAQWASIEERTIGFPQQERSDIEHAFNIARSAHANQFRKSGEPYIGHPTAVFHILLDVGIRDTSLLVLALIHDVEEDSTYLESADRPVHPDLRDSSSTIKASFNAIIAFGLDTLTVPSSIAYSKQEAEQLYLKGLRESSDTGIIVVKMADRLHNLRTLDAMPVEKQQAKITETRRDYYPIFALAREDYPEATEKLFEQVEEAIATAESKLSTH